MINLDTTGILINCMRIQKKYTFPPAASPDERALACSELVDIDCLLSGRFYCTAVNCSSLSVANADLNTTDRIYQTYVNVSCQTGYQFTDNQYWMTTQCQADKTWSTLPTDCTGRFQRLYVTRLLTFART